MWIALLLIAMALIVANHIVLFYYLNSNVDIVTMLVDVLSYRNMLGYEFKPTESEAMHFLILIFLFILLAYAYIYHSFLKTSYERLLASRNSVIVQAVFLAIILLTASIDILRLLYSLPWAIIFYLLYIGTTFAIPLAAIGAEEPSEEEPSEEVGAGEKVLKTLGKSPYKSTYLVEVDKRRMVKVEYVKPELALRGLGYWLQLSNVPGVARLVKFEGNTFYREYVEGKSLREILLKRGALSPREVCSVALGIAGILEEVHSRGFIHCDLKPENVIVRDLGKGDVILIDWEFTARDGEEVTLPRTSIYTPSGVSKASRDIDIHAFCIMIDEMMWGRPFPTVVPTPALEKAFVELANKCYEATSIGEVKRMLEEVCRKI